MTLSVMSVLPALSLVLVEQRPADEDVTAGPLGFLVFISLAAAVVVLYFSLRKQLKRVRFEEQPERPRRGSDPAGGPSAPGSEPR